LLFMVDNVWKKELPRLSALEAEKDTMVDS
jgi:hypothetical protein